MGLRERLGIDRTRLRISIFAFAAALFAALPGAHAQLFNQVIVFGDSNVDSGYYKLLSSPGGNTTYNSLWPMAVADGAGAPTTNPGLLSSQVLAAFFGLTANPSNTAGGTNYATSGAKNVTVNNTQTGGFTAAIPTVTQISNYLAANAGAANAEALYFIYSGDNDASYADGGTGTGPYPSNPTQYMTQAADQLATAIQSLYTAGARHIIVAGLEYDYPSSNPTLMSLKLSYTQTLWAQLTTLGVPFIEGDVNSVRLAIAAHPSQYGFSTISSANPACTEPSGITTAWALLCSSNPSAPSTYVSATAPQTNLFADDQHLATAGQRLMGNYLFRLIVPATVTHDFYTSGDSDILWRGANGDVAIWRMNGTTIAQASDFANVPTAAGWSIVGQRDFNDDGKADLLWRNSNGDVSIWLMNGTTVSQTADLGIVPTAWSVGGTGDFNGDGYGDMLWRNTSTGDVSIWLMNGTTVSQATDFANVPVASNWQIAGTGDFNGDGTSDILWHNTSTGDVSIWLMNGTTISQATDFANVPVASGWTIAGTGDFNGDGKADILWRNTSTGDVSIWLMNGTTISQASDFANVPLASGWTIAETGDFNGDGKSDILWRNTLSGDVSIWLMNGTTISQASDFANVPVAAGWTIQGLNAD